MRMTMIIIWFGKALTLKLFAHEFRFDGLNSIHTERSQVGIPHGPHSD